ncbi:protein of unknown function [Hyphomicrobium sp. MC1]|nr:protein of unknown function [Hyphomicrobium sp. MC1]
MSRRSRAGYQLGTDDTKFPSAARRTIVGSEGLSISTAVGPLRSVFYRDQFSAEPRYKFQRVFFFSEAPNIEPLVVAPKRVATRTKR